MRNQHYLVFDLNRFRVTINFRLDDTSEKILNYHSLVCDCYELLAFCFTEHNLNREIVLVIVR